MKKSILYLSLIVLFSSVQTWGAQSEYLHQNYLSPRVMGMGGAFMGLADDFNALFYNSAGLARLEEGQLNLGIQGGGTPGIINFQKDLKDAGNDPVKIQNVLAKYVGEHFSSRVSIGGVWVRPHWGIAVIPIDLSLEADIRSSLGPAVGVQGYQDALVQFGIAWNFLTPEKSSVGKPKEEVKEEKPAEEKKPDEEKPAAEGEQKEGDAAAAAAAKPEEKKDDRLASTDEKVKKAEEAKKQAEMEAKKKEESESRVYGLSIGVAPKAVYRAYVEKDLTLFDLQTSSTLFRPEDAQEGLGFDFDIGGMYSFGIPEDGFFKFLKYMKPTLGFGIRNVIDSGFASNAHLIDKNSTLASTKLERRFDLGARFELPQLWVFYPRFLVDFRDMGTKYASFKKCSHFGAELRWKVASWLHGGYRVGISQGYMTAGVSANLLIFMLDLVTYAEEIGTADSPRQSRRYMARMSLDF